MRQSMYDEYELVLAVKESLDQRSYDKNL